MRQECYQICYPIFVSRDSKQKSPFFLQKHTTQNGAGDSIVFPRKRRRSVALHILLSVKSSTGKGAVARLITALLARDEADKYLRRVLENALSFSDTVLVLDDRSTDDSPKIAREMGCQVRGRSVLKDPAWGHESPARAELWDWATQEAGDGWVLIMDADQILHGDPRPLMETWEFNSWAFILLDLWDETHFRVDGYWKGHVTPRCWMVRPSTFGPDWTPQWNGRGMHVGHIPPNAPLACGIAPPEQYYWLHLGYASPELRKAKLDKYLAVADQLTPQELAHARSIADPT